MTQVSAPAIEVRDLRKAFGAVQAVDGVSFTVEPGELFFLLGPSGCGKTTLLRLLAGLERPDGGAILFHGRDVGALPPHRRGAPMVFQSYALWPHLDVGDNVAFGLVEAGLPKAEVAARVRAALAQVELTGLEKRRPGQLSGGQQQRVALARALAPGGGLLLLDEPLSNLDARLRAEMRREIATLHGRRDLSMVYVTHDQAEALSLADRLAVMDRGRIVALGRPDDLYHRPPSAFCARFLGEANLVPVEVEPGGGEGVVLRSPFGTWRAAAGRGVPSRGRCLCLVRPENLRPADGQAGANLLEAETLACRTNGNTLSIALRGCGVDLAATVLNRPGAACAPGSRLCWAFAPEHAVLLADEEHGRGGQAAG